MQDGREVMIRQLTVEDCEYNGNYEKMYQWLHQVNTFLTREFNESDLEQNKKQFYEFLSSPEKAFTIAGFFTAKIIAQTMLRYNFKKKKTSHVGNWGIVIHPEFQHQGLGFKLLQLMEQIAERKGLTRLEAAYVDGNIAAETLYLKKLHYQVEGRKKNGILMEDGEYRDVIAIGKLII